MMDYKKKEGTRTVLPFYSIFQNVYVMGAMPFLDKQVMYTYLKMNFTRIVQHYDKSVFEAEKFAGFI